MIIRENMLPCQEAATFVIGDFNFVPTDERRIDAAADAEVRRQEPIAEYWEHEFADMTEIHQSAFTWRQTEDAVLTTLSRLARLYCDVCPLALAARCASAEAVGNINQPSLPSDHIPVTLRIAGVGTSGRGSSASIPRWVAKQHSFATHVTELVLGLASDFGHGAFADISVMSDVFRIVADRVRRHSVAPGADTVSSRLYWTEKFVRAVCSVRDERAAKRMISTCLVAHSELCEFVKADACMLTGQPGLVARLASLAGVDLVAQRTGLDNSGDFKESANQRRRARLVEQSRRWLSKKRRITLTGIISASDGSALTSPEEAAAALSAHWQPVFSAKRTCAVARAHLLQFIHRDLPAINLIISSEEFNAICDRDRECALGPDGIPYLAWLSCITRARTVLYNAYRSLLESAGTPDGFNLSVMVLPPKGDHEDDVHGATRIADKTRPLSMSNTAMSNSSMAASRS